MFEPPLCDVPKLRKFAVLTRYEVKQLIMEMSTKSCELDLLPTSYIKDHLNQFLDIYTRLVNLSLEHGLFHRSWKSAVVRPLLKKIGLELLFKSYRPVSNLSFLSKLVERVVLKQFLTHCTEYGLIPDYQSAYREGHSCETSVLKLVNDVLWGMERQQVTACVFLDLSAAFDTVNHPLLINILEKSFGITDTALHWYESYLSPRDFKVVINEKYSTSKDLTFSVPQGSASGANLFTAYCSSIDSVIPKDVQLLGFADDHLIYKLFKSNQTSNSQERNTIKTLENTMDDVKQWMDQMRLKMNTNKTEFILFGSKQQLIKTDTQTFNSVGDMVQKSNVVRCLGVFLDCNLSFKHHVIKKARTAMSSIIRIRNIRNFLNKQACETLVTGMVLSHLDYANSVLVGLPDITLNYLQRVQNFAAKVVLNRDRYSSSTDALKELHWLPIRGRIIFKIVCLIHKCLFGNGPNNLKNLLVRRPTDRRTLRSNKESNILIVPFVKNKTFASRAFSVAGPFHWNELSEELRTVTNYQTFKSKL